MNRSMAFAISSILALQLPSRAAEPVKAPSIKASKSYSVMSGKTRLGTIRSESKTPIEVTSDSSFHDRATGIHTFTGNAKISCKFDGDATATYTASSLRLVPLK
jgi:hypothetical protein